jgi:multidrug efflux system outer membrane protein
MILSRAQGNREEQALGQYQQAVLIAFEDANSALTAYAKEQIRRQSLVRSVQANERALKLADDLYRHGLTDFIRVLVSQRGLYLSQDSLVQSDHFVALNLVAIYKALGGGWEVSEAGRLAQRPLQSNEPRLKRSLLLIWNTSPCSQI